MGEHIKRKKRLTLNMAPVDAKPSSSLTLEEVRNIMSSGLGKAELEFATSITAPLYWIIKEGDSNFSVGNP